MSDNEHEHQPPSPQLTRRQLRELRNTASTPIITGDGAPIEVEAGHHIDAPHDGGADDVAPGHSDTDESGTATPSAPLPRPADEAVVSDLPVPDASVDLGSPALTRRQARLQEKIRTASVPIILPDAAEADAAARAAEDEGPETADGAESVGGAETAERADDSEASDVVDGPEGDAVSAADEQAHEHSPNEADEVADAEGGVVAAADESAVAHDSEADEVDEVEEERHVVSEELGAALLSGDAGAAPAGDVPASFDQLLSRSAAATGAFTAPNALILTQSPEDGPLVAPVTATGEVLITGTFALPENYGSTGVVPGSADGKEVDAVLIDGELPASSSPTPIAASAAISTIKSAEDVIRPPAPEKGGRWMFALAITAGVLAAALVGVLIFALATGV